MNKTSRTFAFIDTQFFQYWSHGEKYIQEYFVTIQYCAFTGIMLPLEKFTVYTSAPCWGLSFSVNCLSWMSGWQGSFVHIEAHGKFHNLSITLSHLPPCNHPLTPDRTFLSKLPAAFWSYSILSALSTNSQTCVSKKSGRWHFLPLDVKGWLRWKCRWILGSSSSQTGLCLPCAQSSIFLVVPGIFNHLVTTWDSILLRLYLELWVLPQNWTESLHTLFWLSLERPWSYSHTQSWAWYLAAGVS